MAFSVLGFPVFVQWSALLVVGLLVFGGGGLSDSAAMGRGILYAVAILISILVHELGHAVVGRRLGLEPRRIVVHGFGGLCEYGRRPSPKQGVISAAAGPAAGLMLGGACFLLALGFIVSALPVPDGVMLFLDQMIWINVVWSLFNLLPIHPLDGGSVLSHGLLHYFSPRKAWVITRWVTIGVAVPVGLLGLATGHIFVPVILGLIVMDKLRA